MGKYKALAKAANKAATIASGAIWMSKGVAEVGEAVVVDEFAKMCIAILFKCFQICRFLVFSYVSSKTLTIIFFVL